VAETFQSLRERFGGRQRSDWIGYWRVL
jgi:hypothetical protein